MAEGRWEWRGEAGPELVHLPSDAKVCTVIRIPVDDEADE